jgi:DNA-binding transcriptional regulator YiaG
MPRRTSDATTLPLPENWPENIHDAVRCAAHLAHWSIIECRSWCANATIPRVRAEARAERAEHALATESAIRRLNRSRLERVPARHRPHYVATERMEILQLKALNAWSAEETAQRFLVTSDTIRSWERASQDPNSSLLSLDREPVNRFPDWLGYMVGQFKTLCPGLGKKKIVEILARAGLHLSATTTWRILRNVQP